MSGKTTRTYGRSAPRPDTASSLFDAAFSSSSAPSTAASTSGEPNSRQASKRPSPKKVDELVKSRSPPIELPFSPPSADDADSPPDTKKNKVVRGLDNDQDSDDDDDDRLLDIAPRSQGSTASISNKMDMADLNDDAADESPKRPHDAFDFDDDNDAFPEPKKQKSSDEGMAEVDGGAEGNVFRLKRKEAKPAYTHKWTQEDEEDEGENGDAGQSSNRTAIRPPPKEDTTFKSPAPAPPAPMRSAAETRVRNVKEAHQCLESGEHDDYKHDLEYLLSSLAAAKKDVKLKCLSTLSLAKKCVAPEFRQFLRSQNLANKILRALSDAHQYPTLALCTSCVVYLLARDKLSVAVDMYGLRLIVKLVQLDSLDDREEISAEYAKCAKQVWAVLSDWREKASEGISRELMFDMSEETLSTSFLALESLVYISARVTDQWLKNELLNLGALQWLVIKVEKCVSKLTANQENQEELRILERCFRILESCTLINKKNQAFLISHKSSSLLQSSAKLIGMCHKKIERDVGDARLLKLNIDCLSGVARVLMNLTHENELCCTKLGQMDNFLRLCLSCFTFLNGKFAPADKHFDLAVMLSSLLVNLVERCNSNRRKLLSLEVPTFDSQSNTVNCFSALKALTMMFLRHEAAARTVDEELDRDLELDDAPEEEEKGGSDDEGDKHVGASEDGRLQRTKEPTEEEMAETLQAAMNKASSHMEDSVIASYIALLVGCLVQQNEDAVSTVKSLLPNDSLAPMIEQLQRFLEFMKIAHAKGTGNRSVERIIDLLERLN
uniref:WAPL domain-containing protein n=1 Tax=Plectus sambesii TaxID=2011161 RepID=A0A914V3C9_9BILA